MVDRITARMIIAYSVEHNCVLEHSDVHSAFLHDVNKFKSPVYVELRADGTYRHDKTVGILRLNLYRKQSGTFYYIEGLLEFLKNSKPS